MRRLQEGRRAEIYPGAAIHRRIVQLRPARQIGRLAHCGNAPTGAIAWKYHSKRPMLASVTTTAADLVFTGELTGDFLVLDAREGNVLYRFNTGGPVTAGIITHAIGGKQYVAVMSGAAVRFWRTPPASSTVIIFALP